MVVVVVVCGHVSPDTNLTPENVRWCQGLPGRVKAAEFDSSLTRVIRLRGDARHVGDASP